MVNFRLKSQKESNNECCINTTSAKESVKNFGVYMNINYCTEIMEGRMAFDEICNYHNHHHQHHYVLFARLIAESIQVVNIV